jgi:integrase
MASVAQRKGSSNWYACITVDTPEGSRTQKQFSTGLTDRAEALAVAVAAERAARKHGAAPHQLRAALEKIAQDFTPAADADPADWLEAWAKRVKPTVSRRTAEAYEDVAEATATWMRANGVRSFSSVTVERLTALRDAWRESGNTAVTCNTKLKRLSVALEKARQAKLLPENPMREVERLRVTATKRREFRPAELRTLLASLSGEWRALVLLAVYTGQRLTDLAELTWAQVDVAAGTIIFHTGKTGALVSLPLMAPAVDALVSLPTADKLTARVFPEIAALALSSRSNHFRELLAAVGLHRPIGHKDGAPGGKTNRITAELTFHSLRHSATSMLKAAGVSDAIARAIIGHESAAVSRAYTHLDTDTLRAALEKMPTL